MPNIQSFLEAAGNVLADGFATWTEAKAFFDFTVSVVNAGTDPTDADWTKLHEYEQKQLAILDSLMEGE